MRTKKCLSCIPTNKKVAKTSKKRASWKQHIGLKTIFPNDTIPSLKSKVRSVSGANQKVHLDLGPKKAGRKVLYYASQDLPLDKCQELGVLGAIRAYGKFSNQGIAVLDAEGKGVLKIKCPMIYHEEGKTYLPHVHFILSNQNHTGWENKLLTQTVVCKLDFQDMVKVVKNQCALIVNALPFEYYVKDRIPHSVPLDHNMVLDSLDKKVVINYLESLLPHCPAVYQSYQKGKIDLMDIPLVSYCYNTGCEADTDLQEKLNQIGFTNVKVYEEGIVGWNKNMKKSKLKL